MSRLGRLGLVLALPLAFVVASVALATTYRGAGVADAEMPVKVKASKDGSVSFEYSEVLVECSNGERLREPGAEHSGTLNQRDRFKDKIEQAVGGGLATSQVKGRVGARKAVGTVSFDLTYDGGSCHSGEVEWKAKRK